MQVTLVTCIVVSQVVFFTIFMFTIWYLSCGDQLASSTY